MSDLRIGHGYDIHRLTEGGELVMGGVVVAQGISPIAHSDGDVVIHAIADALLGAMGMGDIGQHFPDTNPAYRGIRSTWFLETITEGLRRQRFVVTNCDVTVVAERPKLGPFKQQMQDLLGDILKCPVNIKAGTNEGCGEIGRGEAVAAHAVVLLARID